MSTQDRILILAPHPDDEVIGCAGILQKAVANGLPVRVVFLTYGDANQFSFLVYRRRPELLPQQVESMGMLRHDEAVRADTTLGVPQDDLVFLGYPDFGTLTMWASHWGSAAPYRGMLTHAESVPYKNALRPGAPYKADAVLQDLEQEIADFRPTKIFVSHPADQNPDHLALYLFTRVALWDLHPAPEPELYPYLVHYPQWPAARVLRPDLPLEPPARLADAIQWQADTLDEQQTGRKLAAVKEHASQYSYSASYLDSFVRQNELFGDFPAVQLNANSSRSLPAPGAISPAEPPDQLNDEERNAFVGVESREVRLDGNNLVITIGLSRPLARGVGATIYAFGYRGDRPFAQMPKLRVQVGEFSHRVYDQETELPRARVEVTRALKQITVRVPLATLGSPQRILTSARTYMGDIPLNTISWRILELTGDNP